MSILMLTYVEVSGWNMAVGSKSGDRADKTEDS